MIWTQDQQIQFRCCNQLSYQTMTSTSTHRKHHRAILIWSFAQCSNLSFAFAFVSQHVYFNRSFVEVINWYMWYSILKDIWKQLQKVGLNMILHCNHLRLTPSKWLRYQAFEFKSQSVRNFYSYFNCMFCSVFEVHFDYCLRQSPDFL